MAIGYTLLNIDKDGTPSMKLGPKMGMEPRSLNQNDKISRRKRLDRKEKRIKAIKEW
jgi:hypothetical protein